MVRLSETGNKYYNYNNNNESNKCNNSSKYKYAKKNSRQKRRIEQFKMMQ